MKLNMPMGFYGEQYVNKLTMLSFSFLPLMVDSLCHNSIAAALCKASIILTVLCRLTRTHCALL